jgi:hypothetical protein
VTKSGAQHDRMLERITKHLRGHVAQLRRLERDGAAPEELEERRALIARLQIELAALVRCAIARPKDTNSERSLGRG